MGTRGSKAAWPPEVVGGGAGELLLLAWADGGGGLGGPIWIGQAQGLPDVGEKRNGPIVAKPPLPPDLAQGQFDVWELLPEGLVHVLLEVRGLHVLYHRGLQGRRQQVGELALHSPGGPPA